MWWYEQFLLLYLSSDLNTPSRRRALALDRCTLGRGHSVSTLGPAPLTGAPYGEPPEDRACAAML